MNDLVERLRKAKFRQSHEVEEDAWEAADEFERLRAALTRIEVRGLEIISEHVGGSDASYVAQELTAIAREALREVSDE